MEKIFDIAKDSEQSWGTLATAIDGNFEEVEREVDEFNNRLVDIDGESVSTKTFGTDDFTKPSESNLWVVYPFANNVVGNGDDTIYAVQGETQVFAGNKVICVDLKKGDVVKAKFYGQKPIANGGTAGSYAISKNGVISYIEQSLQDFRTNNLQFTADTDGKLFINNDFDDCADAFVQVTSAAYNPNARLPKLENRVAILEGITPTFDALKFKNNIADDGTIISLENGASMASLIHHWGFIGSSTTSGVVVSPSGSASHNYDYSTGKRFCDMNHADCSFFSRGGATAKMWCLSNGIFADAEEYKELAWQGAQKQENIKQAYVINLGMNDSKSSAGYPLGSLETDVDADYNSNADTFCGWICGVIQRLKSINADCYIFLYTASHYVYGDSDKYTTQYAPIIRRLPKFLMDNFGIGRIYLADNNRFGAQEDTNSVLAYGASKHPTIVGYQYEAFVMNTLIDDCIKKNYGDFMWAHLVASSGGEIDPNLPQ